MRRFEPTRYEAIAAQLFRSLQAMHITFDTLLTSAIIGHTLFLVSYLSISLVIHAKRYSRKYVMAQANPGPGIKPQCDMELDLRIDELATRLEHFNHQFVDPPAELGPECDGGLLAALLQANAREVQAMAANIEQPEAVLTIPTAPTYDEMTRTQLLKLVQKQALPLPKGYIKKQTLIAILEGDLAHQGSNYSTVDQSRSCSDPQKVLSSQDLSPVTESDTGGETLLNMLKALILHYQL